MKNKLWYEICESVVTNWSELPAEQRSVKGMLILSFVLLGIMLMMLIYIRQKRTYYKEKRRGFCNVPSHLSVGPVVSMLASGNRVRGFKPGRSGRIFSGEQILSMPSFGREVKPFAPWRIFAAC
jgi:hypothetical protein